MGMRGALNQLFSNFSFQAIPENAHQEFVIETWSPSDGANIFVTLFFCIIVLVSYINYLVNNK
jgi:hypothetical protein